MFCDTASLKTFFLLLLFQFALYNEIEKNIYFRYY